ncbi:MAG: glucosamine-6-phosphate deaminase [Dehalococcoidia bacterium]
MRVVTVRDAGEVASRAAGIIAGVVRGKPAVRLGLPTGATPIGAYAELARLAADGGADFSRATGYAIDEFVCGEGEGPGTNAAYYRQHLRLPLGGLHAPDASAADPEAHIRAYAEGVREGGGLDLCVLGVGVNGHIAFNEPGAERDARARVVELTETTRTAHAAAFGGIERVPRRGMTLGVAEILEARALLVLATGGQKAGAVRRAVEEEPSAETPASWLRGHADVTWLIDEAAAAGLRQG